MCRPLCESKEQPEGRNKQVEINSKALICLCPFFPFCNVLKDARQKFRSVLVEATVKLDELVKKIGKAVEDSKPYWEARRVAKQAQLEAQRATQDFQRATEVLRAAKETISLAEQRLLEDDKRQFDSAWQEMLNHATQRVMEAEQTKTRSELVHKETAAKYNAAMGRMKQLEKKLKRAINKSKYVLRLEISLEVKSKMVDDLQAKLALAKGEYKTALKNLEMISDEIHERRRSTAMGPRGCGVGAEGSNTSVEDLSANKSESDTISSEYRALPCLGVSHGSAVQPGCAVETERQPRAGLRPPQWQEFSPGVLELPRSVLCRWGLSCHIK
uniref:SH3 domain-binding protein 5 n=1 Tax=Strix occidentalis caurina TaxID=311401 RepID=A0A8D0F3Y2_STROC